MHLPVIRVAVNRTLKHLKIVTFKVPLVPRVSCQVRMRKKEPARSAHRRNGSRDAGIDTHLGAQGSAG